MVFKGSGSESCHTTMLIYTQRKQSFIQWFLRIEHLILLTWSLFFFSTVSKIALWQWQSQT